jgi:hypothetical protein
MVDLVNKAVNFFFGGEGVSFVRSSKVIIVVAFL